jgi:ATP-dependent Clp protease ATP-binding subunit ClpX
LRAILEEVLRDIMFDLPSRDDIVEVRVTEGCITNGTPPLLEIAPRKQRKEA